MPWGGYDRKTGGAKSPFLLIDLGIIFQTAQLLNTSVSHIFIFAEIASLKKLFCVPGRKHMTMTGLSET